MNQMNAATVAWAGYKAMMKGKRLLVPGWFNKLMVSSIRFSPRGVVLQLGRRLMRT